MFRHIAIYFILFSGKKITNFIQKTLDNFASSEKVKDFKSPKKPITQNIIASICVICVSI